MDILFDGHKYYGGILSLTEADGKSLSLMLEDASDGGTFIVYNGTLEQYDLINGSRVDFKYDGSVVYSRVITDAHTVISLVVPSEITFDEITLTFDGDVQSIREIEFWNSVLEVDENAPVGHVVYDASLLFPELTPSSYGLLFGQSHGDISASSMLSIDRITGQIMLLNVPDYEMISHYQFSVSAVHDAVTTTRSLTLNVRNLLEAPVLINPDRISIDENTPLDTVIHQVHAVADGAGEGVLNFALMGDDADQFTINDQGELTLNSSPDYEMQSHYTFRVRVYDNDLFVEQDFTVAVTDIDENIVFDTVDVAVSLLENVLRGHVVYTASATDPDNGSPPISYHLLGVDAALFTVDSQLGSVVINSSPDYATKPRYAFTIRATQGNGVDTVHTDQDVIVTVEDQYSDEEIRFTSAEHIYIAEGGDGVIYQAEISHAASVSYRLTGSDSSHFDISDKGYLTPKVSLDYETQSEYSFVITALVDGVLLRHQAFTVHVIDGDESGDAPVVQSSLSVQQVGQGVERSIDVGRIFVDSENSALTYTAMLVDSGGVNPTTVLPSGLSINRDTGIFSASTSVAVGIYEIEVTAEDLDGLSVSDRFWLEINPVHNFFTSASGVIVSETVTPSDIIYTAVVSRSNNDTVVYSLYSGTGVSIDAQSGAVTFTSSVDYGTQPVYEFVVQARIDDGTTSMDSLHHVTVNLEETIVVLDAVLSIYENSLAGNVVYDAGLMGDYTYSLSGTDSLLFTIDADTGRVTINDSPDYEMQSHYDFTVTATSNRVSGVVHSSEWDIALEIVNLGDALPSFESVTTTVTMDENIGFNTVIYTADLTIDTDDNVYYRLKGVDAAHFTMNGLTGEVRLIASPDYETQSVYELLVEGHVGGGVFLQEVLVMIDDVLEAPIFTGDRYGDIVIEEGVFEEISLDLSRFSDPDGGVLTYTAMLIDPNDNNSLIALPNGVYFDSQTGVLSIGEEASVGAYSLDITAEDNASSSVSEGFNLRIVAKSDLTFTSAESFSIDEDVNVSAVIYTADVLGRLSAFVTYRVTGTDASLLSINNSGEVTLNAPLSSGDYTFSIEATSGSESWTQNVTMSVVAKTPSRLGFVDMSAVSLSIGEDILDNVVIYVALEDAADVNAIDYTLGGSDAARFVINDSGEVTLGSALSRGNYTFSIIASDALDSSLSESKNIMVTVEDPSHDPVIAEALSDQRFVFNKGGIFTIPSTRFADTDGDSLVYSAHSLGYGFLIEGLSFETSTRIFTVSEDLAVDDYDIIVSVVDATGRIAMNSFTLHITLPEPPVFSSSTLSWNVTENVTAGYLVGSVVASVSDASDIIIYSLSGTDSLLFTIDADTGRVTINDSPDYETQSEYLLTVIATSSGVSSVQHGVVSVSDVNETPVYDTGSAMSDQAVIAGLEQDFMLDVSGFSDIDGDVLVYRAGLSGGAPLPSWIVFDPSHLSFTIRDTALVGSYSIEITAMDGGSLSVDGVFELTVTSPDVPNFVTSNAVTVAENHATNAVIHTALALPSVENQSVTYSVNGIDSSYFVIDGNTGDIRFASSSSPNHEDRTSYTFNVQATSLGVSSMRAMTVNITDMNDEVPVFAVNSIDITLNENSAAYTQIHTALATADVLGDSVIYTLENSDARYFSIDNGGGITFDISPNYEEQSRYVFNIRATVGLLSQSQQVTLDIIDINEAPVIDVTLTELTGMIDENILLTSDNVVQGRVVATDGDDANLTYSVVTNSNYGIASIDNHGVWSYVLDNSDISVDALADPATLTDEFTIQVADSHGLMSNSEVVTLTINGRDDVIGTSVSDTLDRSSVGHFEFIQGGDGDDEITVGTGGSIIFAGGGNDTITLQDGATDVIVYRYSSSGGDNTSYTALDGFDILNNFKLGEDKFLFVDMDTPTVDDDGAFFRGMSNLRGSYWSSLLETDNSYSIEHSNIEFTDFSDLSNSTGRIRFTHSSSSNYDYNSLNFYTGGDGNYMLDSTALTRYMVDANLSVIVGNLSLTALENVVGGFLGAGEDSLDVVGIDDIALDLI